jgi:hypothetical protein
MDDLYGIGLEAEAGGASGPYGYGDVYGPSGDGYGGDNYDLMPDDWWNTADTPNYYDPGSIPGFDDSWTEPGYVSGTGDSWLDNTGIPNAVGSLYGGLQSLGQGWTDSGLGNVFNKNTLGTLLNAYMSYKGLQSTKNPPSYQQMKTPTEIHNDPYTQAMLDQTTRQVGRAAGARGVAGTAGTLQQIADTTYARNLIPMMQTAAQQNMAANQQRFQGWQNQANASNQWWNNMGTGVMNLANQSEMTAMIQQILNSNANPEAKAGEVDGLSGNPPDQAKWNTSADYASGYIRGKNKLNAYIDMKKQQG